MANERIVSLINMLKSPMILMAIAGLGMVFGMPYIMENSTSALFLHPSLLCSLQKPFSSTSDPV